MILGAHFADAGLSELPSTTSSEGKWQVSYH